MRVMGVRQWASAMAETGMPHGAFGSTKVQQEYRRKNGARAWRAIAVRLLSMVTIGVMLCDARAGRLRRSRNAMAAASRKRNRR